MTGAHKCNKNDIVRLRELMKEGYGDTWLHRNFVTENGSTLSTDHIKKIRTGKRWNPSIRSFVVKDELGTLNSMKTSTENTTLLSQVGKVITKTSEYWVFLHFKDTSLVAQETYLTDDENVAKTKFQVAHQEFVKHYL
jgi:hypothetical protein